VAATSAALRALETEMRRLIRLLLIRYRLEIAVVLLANRSLTSSQ
jgi:hypothetical protein